MAPAPVQLTEKYRARRLEDLAGLDAIKAILGKLAENPYSSAWYFVGESGTGKSSAARALATHLDAELLLIPSRTCNLQSIEDLRKRCSYVPMGGGFHFVLVEEADQMTGPAQLAFLTLLDSASMPESTIFVFTANSVRGMEGRFMSRVRTLTFDARSLDQPAAGFLAKVWQLEGGARELDFADVFLRSGRNMRSALMNLELLLLDPSMPLPEAPAAAPIPMPTNPDRRAAALKAWETMRRKKAQSV